ncbi:hypothetical protein ACLOJK_020582 [Asimina triloba]
MKLINQACLAAAALGAALGLTDDAMMGSKSPAVIWLNGAPTSCGSSAHGRLNSSHLDVGMMMTMESHATPIKAKASEESLRKCMVDRQKPDLAMHARIRPQFPHSGPRLQAHTMQRATRPCMAPIAAACSRIFCFRISKNNESI